jgi:hypothetical protein
MKTQSLVNKIINDFLSLLQNRHTTIMSYQKFTATACPFINQSLVEETIMNILENLLQNKCQKVGLFVKDGETVY